MNNTIEPCCAQRMTPGELFPLRPWHTVSGTGSGQYPLAEIWEVNTTAQVFQFLYTRHTLICCRPVNELLTHFLSLLEHAMFFFFAPSSCFADR